MTNKRLKYLSLGVCIIGISNCEVSSSDDFSQGVDNKATTANSSNIDRPSEESEGIPGYRSSCTYLTPANQEQPTAEVQCRLQNESVSDQELRRPNFIWTATVLNSEVTLSSRRLAEDSIYHQSFTITGNDEEAVLEATRTMEVSIYDTKTNVEVLGASISSITADIPANVNNSDDDN